MLCGRFRRSGSLPNVAESMWENRDLRFRFEDFTELVLVFSEWQDKVQQSRLPRPSTATNTIVPCRHTILLPQVESFVFKMIVAVLHLRTNLCNKCRT